MSGPRWPDDAVTRWSRRGLAVVSLLVPAGARKRWRREWEAELFELRRRGAGRVRTLAFVAGSIPHGIWTRKEEWNVDSLRQDLGYALRTLKKSPGFASATVLMLALGIGATTALFTVLREAVLRPPPYPRPERLVVVDHVFHLPDGRENTMAWSYPKFRAFREEVGGLEGVAGYRRMRLTVTGAGDPTIIQAEAVTPAYFSLLGARPALGSLDLPEAEDGSRPQHVAILSYGLWQGRFGGDPGTVGRRVTLNGTLLTVVGVLPRGFSGLTGSARVWIPFGALPELDYARRLEAPLSHWFRAVGRLAPGTSLESARAGVMAAGRAIEEAVPSPPQFEARPGADLTPLREARVNPVARTSTLVLFGAVTLVLLIACANVAGLTLVRNAGRRRETAVRAAMGAGRTRLLRQFLAESVVISLVAGALGLGVAWLGVDLLGTALVEAIGTSGTRALQYLDPAELELDAGVFAFACLASLGTGVLFGILPAVRGSRPDLTGALKEGAGSLARGSDGGGRRRMAGGPVLVVGQVALALILLVGAGLMLRSLAGLQGVELGMNPENLLTVSYELPRADPAAEQPALFLERLTEEVRGLPGVEGVTSGCPPLSGACDITVLMQVEGRPPGSEWIVGEGEVQQVGVQYVGDRHFRVLGTRILEGRDLRASDGSDAPLVMVLNETAARTFFPGEEAVGKRIKIGAGPLVERFGRVVGVVEDIPFRSPEEEILPEAFLPYRQHPRAYATLMIRTSGDPLDLVPAVREQVQALNPSLPLRRVATMEERTAEVTARSRVVSYLLTAFGALALFLAVMGIYGVVAFSVARRIREFGLRMALGARGPDLAGMVLRQGLAMAAVGVLLGLGGAWYGSHLLSGLLYEVEPTDPVTYVGVALGLLSVAALAGLVPARRAVRVDPVEALRAE